MEAVAGGWDPVHAQGNGIWHASVGVLELLVGMRPFDHVHEISVAPVAHLVVWMDRW